MDWRNIPINTEYLIVHLKVGEGNKLFSLRRKLLTDLGAPFSYMQEIMEALNYVVQWFI